MNCFSAPFRWLSCVLVSLAIGACSGDSGDRTPGETEGGGDATDGADGRADAAGGSGSSGSSSGSSGVGRPRVEPHRAVRGMSEAPAAHRLEGRAVARTMAESTAHLGGTAESTQPWTQPRPRHPYPRGVGPTSISTSIGSTSRATSPGRTRRPLLTQRGLTSICRIRPNSLLLKTRAPTSG